MREIDKQINPKHYSNGQVDVIAFSQMYGLDFIQGNVVKYIVRAGNKKYEGKSMEESKLIDLEKAKEYIQREIDRLTPKELPF